MKENKAQSKYPEIRKAKKKKICKTKFNKPKDEIMILTQLKNPNSNINNLKS